MSADPRTRAAAVLGLPAGATSAEAAVAFLAGLPLTDFAPPADRVAAVNLLAGAAVPFDADDAPGLTIADAVADFARRFWSLSPTERTAAWLSLSQLAADDSSAARLLALQPGLSVDADPPLGAAAAELAGLIRELFVLPPRER